MITKQQQKNLQRNNLTFVNDTGYPVLLYIIRQSDYIRGCTGFDGDLEIVEAIDGPGPSKNLELNINADNKLAYAA